MKTCLSLLLLGLVMLCGCARHYVITLNNGSQIGTSGKPRLSNGRYVYRDIEGREATVPAGRVQEIAPASMMKSPNTQFNPKPR